jgi:hypothetical protein
MQASLEGLPGMRMVFTQPIEMRMNEMIAGIRADVGVKLFGDSFDVLRDKAREIDRVVAGIPGATDLYTEQITGQPVLEVEVDRAALARYGMTAREVLESVEALAGVEVAELREGERRFPLAVRIDEAYQQDPAALGRLLISNAKGERVPSPARRHAAAGGGPYGHPARVGPASDRGAGQRARPRRGLVRGRGPARDRRARRAAAGLLRALRRSVRAPGRRPGPAGRGGARRPRSSSSSCST